MSMQEVIEVALRSGFAFLTLLALTRLMGKTEISQLTFFDYVVGISVGTLAASISIDLNKSMAIGITALVVWSALKIGSGILTLKSIPARKLLEGEPTVVIKNGKLMEEAMARSRYNFDSLQAQLRNNKVFDLSQVEEAVLETNGKLSVLLKSQHQPVTPTDMKISTKYKGMPQVLVVDGNLAKNRLDEIGLSEEWLYEQLANQGVNDLSEVMVAQLNTSGELYIDKKSDWL